MTRQSKKKAPQNPLMIDGREWDRKKVMDYVCEQLSTTTFSLRNILDAKYHDNPLPSRSTIMVWLREDAHLSDQYARAREMQADLIVDEILEIADDSRNDWMEIQDRQGEVIGHRVDNENIQRSRLRVEARKWLLSKLLPKKYGDKLQTELTGRDGGPIEHGYVLTPEQAGSIEEWEEMVKLDQQRL